MPSSNRSSKGFIQLPESKAATIYNANDTTINIPLTNVPTNTGARKRDTYIPPTSEKPKLSHPEQPISAKTDFYQRHVAGRRKAAKKTGRQGEDGEEDAMTRMGIIYNKILNFSIITRYILYILPLAILISVPIIVGATATQNATIGGVRIVWVSSWVLIVWASLWASKLTAKTLPAVFVFLCGIVSSGTRKYALVIRALEIYLSLCGWALASLATFIPIMTRNPTQRAQAATYTKYQNSTDPAQKASALQYKDAAAVQHWMSIFQNILAALLVASLVLLAEKLLIQLISISYHRKQFNTKIRESKHKIYLLSLLYDASRALFPAYCNEFSEEDYIINDSLEFAEIGHNHNSRPGSADPTRLLQNVGRLGDKVTSAFGNIAHEVTGKQVFNPSSAHSIVVEALEKNRSSEALAKRLWMSFVVEGKEALYQEDLVEVLGSDHHDEAEEAFAVIDRDSNGDISLDEMVLTVCEFGRERHSISSSLHDVDQAINVLDSLLCTIVLVMVIFVFVGFLNSSFTTTLATAGTALLSLSFVFAATAQEVLGSCIFLFVKHPFDVLDRVDIGTDQLIVKHISLLFTVFKHINNHKLTQVPNIVLNTQWIDNISRSDAMREQLLLYISFDTSLEDLQLLRNEMHAFVTDKENSRDFQPDIDVEITGIAEMNKLELKVEIRHKSNWSNETVRAARRSKFMCALVLAIRKIPINAPGVGAAALGSADQPSYSVAVSDAEAAASRDAFKRAQDAKRLFPITKSESPAKNEAKNETKSETRSEEKSDDRGLSTGTDSFNPHSSDSPPPLRYRLPPASESTALNTLNSRHPAADTANAPNDMIEPTTPKSLAHSVSGTATPPDVDQTVSIEDVRGLLRRRSTRGKRKTSIGSAKLSDVISALPQPPHSVRLDYDPYTYGSREPPIPAPPRDLDILSSQSQNRKKQQQKSRHSTSQSNQSQPQRTPPAQSQTPRSVPNHLQPAHFQPPQPQQTPQSLLDQQRPATPTSSLRKATEIVPPPQAQSYQPVPPPKDPIHITTSNLTAATATSPTEPRAISPVRNPFQIHALRSQAQGVGVPQMVQTRPESGARERKESQAQQMRPDSEVISTAQVAIRKPVQQRTGTGSGSSLGKDGGGFVRSPRGDSLAPAAQPLNQKRGQ